MDFRLGVCQTPVLSAPKELQPYLEAISRAETPGLWLFPELFLGGFDLQRSQHWADQAQEALALLSDFSRATGHALAGTFLERSAGGFQNSLYLLSPELAEPLKLYSKIHLFPASNEAKLLTPGAGAMVTPELRGLRLGGCICFDLRFPEVCRVQAARDVHVYLVPAQWPKARLDHFTLLCRARALENQAMVLAANCCGPSPLGEMPGASMLVGPWGQMLMDCDDQPGVHSTVVDLDVLKAGQRLFSTRTSPVLDVTSRILA
ncbi:nitrilase-related carbon-nitrogen hydrolase [Desulfocurvibacter africanus]|uniref:Nitrilase/cyanide hydratase and apolipoprotein N-acyltransferase n=1 Tax=Desulfocurvibacter africanus subsp. africanus str. Walvis Bay TaxID=690850 RepID=F3Z0F7_DESAF|nr:nitrilase-related carbon-nitrogen hydrolase [Desulfocurvibacter africanus]EGJ50967.1 Nitrilase/cyanide hydratase and apolipoprotein N-acyltransferase [Desulfocurvibacter africanus subsp. africanus str. Walvis Bay]